MQSASFPSVQTYTTRTLWMLLVVVFLLPLGCGESLPPLAEVKGTVTVDGQKLEKGQVSLIPEKVDPAHPVPPSTGEIKSGSYEIFTGGKPGAPLGKYKVKVTPGMTSSSKNGPGFDKKYLDATKTPLGFEVVNGGDAARYELKLTK